MASDRITVDGLKVGYMYREEGDFEQDGGWRFMAGDEDDSYLSNPENFAIFDVNTIANYDPDIIGCLDAPVGAEFARQTQSDPLIAVSAPADD